MSSITQPSSPLVLHLACVAVLALGAALPAAAAPEPPPWQLETGPSAWIDGAWTPLHSTAPPATAAAFAVAAGSISAAAEEGSGLRQIWPLFTGDGTAERALFAPLIDGGRCLWTTDGTSAGTFPLQPDGECVPMRDDFPFVAAAEGVAYFVAGQTTFRYWRSDGTTEGTWPLMGFSDEGLYPRRFNVFPDPASGRVFFVADDGVHGPELWVADDETPQSAELLERVPGPGGAFAFRFQPLGEQVVFFTYRGGFEYELWTTDGTPAGTRLVTVVGSETFYTGPQSAYRVDAGVAFFLGGIGPCVVELWITDGTAAGTQPIRAFTGDGGCPLTGAFQGDHLDGFAGTVFFAADGGDGSELWRTDGTAAGTFALTDLSPDQPFPRHFPLNSGPAALDGSLYFAADDGVHGTELWRSDGSPAGAALVADLCPGPCSSDPDLLRTVGDRLVFVAEEPAAGRELWTSDGTAGGTSRASDLCAGACGATITLAVPFDGSLALLADDGSHGQELWLLTPPAGPLTRLSDFAPVRPFGSFLNFVPLGDELVFTADDGVHGREPWATDGTPARTRLLIDLQPGDTEPLPEPPIAPANLRLEELGQGFVRLTWEDRSDDETGFVIDVLRPGSSAWQSSTTIDADLTSLERHVDLGTTGFRVRATNGPVQSPPSNEVFVTVTGFCAPSDEVLCLGEGRFAVSVQWNNQHAGPGDPFEGHGRAVPAGAGADDSGYFWFFTPDNLELVVKVLDGTTVNDHFWVFWGALSDVEYWIHVQDTVGGGSRMYHNPPGQICGGSDTTAFPLDGASGGFATAPASGGRPAAAPPPARLAVASGPATRFLALDAPVTAAAPAHQACVADEDTLCLLDGELAVSVDWTDQHNGGSGVGRAIPSTDLTGFFWFFHPENVELVVKALDGRTVNGKIWVFYGALTDVGYTITVEHLASEAHAVRTYENPPGVICGRGDTAAF